MPVPDTRMSADFPDGFLRAIHRPAALRQLHETDLHTRDTGQVAEPKRIAWDDALAAPQIEGGHRPRFLVRITSIRKRLLDEDNLVGKYHTDLLRYAGILPSDAPGEASIQATQRKTAKGEEERTLIEVFENRR